MRSVKGINHFALIAVALFTAVCHAEGIPRLTISGTPTGGSATIGIIGDDKVITVATHAGDTPAQIVSNFVAASNSRSSSSIYSDFQASTDGVTIVTSRQPGKVYFRTTDGGLDQVSAVSNLQAVSSKALGKVTLTWTVPNPAPGVIYVTASGGFPVRLSGTTTTFVDTDPPPTPYVTYRVICGKQLDAVGDALKVSDVAQVTTDNPAQMDNDTFSIVNPSIENEVVGKAVKIPLVKNAGTNPVTWSVDSGSLPNGVTLDQAGSLNGAATTAGTYQFSIKATDATGATATKAFSVTVNQN